MSHLPFLNPARFCGILFFQKVAKSKNIVYPLSYMRKNLNLRANIALGLIFAFLVNTFGPIPSAQAQEFRLPAPGVMVYLSPEFNPPILKGIKVHPDNPFRFDFILDKGDSLPLVGRAREGELKQEATRLIKYFLASLTIPEKDLWVNLSPYEKDRIVPESFGQTQMGRDLLAEDYMLKQITASLIYPEGEVGKKFWKRIYEESAKKFGTTNIPVNTFNKVWIVPEKAVVYENAKAGTAYVVASKLKVMLEEDYLSLEKHGVIESPSGVNALGSQIVREIVIPELTKEVNEDKNFAQLRQVYNSLILATWYKKKIKDSILAQVYENKNKVAGVNIDDPKEKEKIYQRYLEAFKKGVYNYIKEEIDPVTQGNIPRKYFSGGFGFIDMATRIEIEDTKMPVENISRLEDLTIDMAMSAKLNGKTDEKFILDQKQYPMWKTNARGYILFVLLEDEDPNVQSAGLKQIAMFAKKKPGILDARTMERVEVLLKHHNSDVFQAAVQAPGSIVEKKSELLDTGTMEKVVARLDHREWHVRRGALQELGTIVEKKPGLLDARIMEKVVALLDDPNDYVLQAALETLGSIVGKKSELLDTRTMEKVVTFLDNLNRNVHQAAVHALGIIVENKPDLVKGVMEGVVARLEHREWHVLQAALQALGIIAEKKPELLDTGTMEKVVVLLEHPNPDVRRAAIQTLGIIAEKKPGLLDTVKGIMEKVVALLEPLNPDVHQAALKALGSIYNDINVRIPAVETIGIIAANKPELLDVRIMEKVVALLEDPNNYMCQAALETLGIIVEKKPELIKGIVEEVVARLEHREWYVRQAALQMLGIIAEKKPRLLDTGTLGKVRALLDDPNNYVSQTAVQTLGKILSAQDCDNKLIQSMLMFVEDQKEGFGLPQTRAMKGMNLLYAFAEINDPDAMGLFLSTIRQLDQQQRTFLADIAYSYFRVNAFGQFINILKTNRKNNYNSLINSFQEDFIKVIRLDRDIEGRIMDGWDGVARLLRIAGRYDFIQEKIISKIIITLRLLRQGVGQDADFREQRNIETSFPQLKNSLIRLLESGNISLYVKRHLLQSFPLGDRQDIDLLLKRTVRLLNAATGTNEYRWGGILVGDIRERMHNNPSSQDLPVVEAYRKFVESDGREGKEKLEQLGYTVQTRDIVPASRKEQTLRACDDLLVSLRQVYGGGGLENIRESMDALTTVLEAEQRQKISGSWAKIDFLLKQRHYDLENLKTIVEIRQQVNDVIGHVSSEALYQALNLDLRLEILVYRVFNSIDEKSKNSPEGLLLMLRNCRLNGYPGERSDERLDRLAQELESIIKGENGKPKDMRLYAVIKKAERVMKNILGATVSDYQAMALQTGKALGVTEQDQVWVENFSANIVRGDSLYLLSLLISHLKTQIKNELGFTGWQVVVDGTMSGKLHYVDSFDRLNEVKENEILVIDRLPSDSPVLSRVAGIIVFEDDGLLLHPAIRARQNGTPYIVCPDKELIEKYYGQGMTITAQGDVVDIKKGLTQSNKIALQGKAEIQVPSANLNSDIFVLPQDYSPGTTGQKAYNLHEMDHIPLADGQRRAQHLALSFAFYQQILQDPSNQKQKSGMNKIISALEAVKITDEQKAWNLARMRNEIESLKIPPAMLERTREFIRQQIPQGLVFLRSSTNAEDLPGYAGAGLYDSYGAVDPDNLEQLQTYIKKVWASVWNDRAYADRERNGIDHLSVHMAVLIQELVNATYSYVVHTVNPSDNNPNEMMIEIVQGLGEALVSGSAEYQGAPHRFIYNKNTGQIRQVSYADKDWRLAVKDGRLQRELTDSLDDIFINGDVTDMLQGLFKQAKDVEQLFGMKAQDIEGALVKESMNRFDTVFVQSRDQQVVGDRAMNISVSSQKPNKTGGIDLTPADMKLQIQNINGEIKFHMDAVMLQQLQNAPGFVPVIINIQPLKSLQEFLGLNQKQPLNF